MTALSPRRIVTILAVLFTLLTSTTAFAITYGFIDTTNAYPNVGAFVVERNGRIYEICTGTLITGNVFLTASHCTSFYTASLESLGYVAYVSFDAVVPWGAKSVSTTTLLPVSHVVTNPAYNQAQNDTGDIGALVLASPVTGITPATLPSCGLLETLSHHNGLKGAVFTAVGYGLQDRITGEGGAPYNLDANPVPRMFSFSSFDALNPGFIRLSQNPSTGDGGTCSGDSGGPNFLTVEGVQYLAAITITGDAVCRATNVDYRLDTPSALAFLAYVNDEYGTSIPVPGC